jgi:predicted enzyme related to lactoylglutathione lyase
VIAGAHVLLYAEDAEQARAFLRDVVGWEHVDAHDGWLIFALPPAELGVHPDDLQRPSGRHELLLMCHDIARAVDELKKRGVEFSAPIVEEGFGLITRMKVPGAGEMALYEPRHASPLAEFADTP